MNVQPLFFSFLVLAPNFGRLMRVYRFGVVCNNSSKLENSVCGVYVYAAIALNEGGKLPQGLDLQSSCFHKLWSCLIL
jgi:hypothetical protein